MLEPGTSFGAYEIVAAIGTGGAGTVLRVRDTTGTVTLTKN
jgi:hypothetical protein